MVYWMVDHLDMMSEQLLDKKSGQMMEDLMVDWKVETTEPMMARSMADPLGYSTVASMAVPMVETTEPMMARSMADSSVHLMAVPMESLMEYRSESSLVDH